MTLSDDENAHWIGYDRCKAKDTSPNDSIPRPPQIPACMSGPWNPPFQPYPFPKLERRWLDEIV